MVDKNKIRCPGCMEEINALAVKCKHCGRFQNWRRYLGLSSSFLSVVVALISVSTVFATVTINAAKQQDSEIKVSIINRQRVFFNDVGSMRQVLLVESFITNAGQRPGVIKSLAVKGNNDESFRFMRLGDVAVGNDAFPKPIEAVIVEPGNSVLLKSYLKTRMNRDSFNDNYKNSILKFEVANFSGEQSQVIRQFNDSPPDFYQ